MLDRVGMIVENWKTSPGDLFVLTGEDTRVCLRSGGENFSIKPGQAFPWHAAPGGYATSYREYTGELTEEENVLYALAMMGIEG